MEGRDERFTAVQFRLDRAADGDLAAVLEPEALAEARQLAEILRRDDADLLPRYLLGWLHWYQYLALPSGTGEDGLEAAVTMFTPCFEAGRGSLPEPLLPVLAECAVPAALALLRQSLNSADLILVSDTVDLWRRIVDATPAGNRDRGASLANLGNALSVRFKRSGALTDLDAAIVAFGDALEDSPADHPRHAVILSNMGNALRIRFERTGRQTDLDAAIEAGQIAVTSLRADHPSRPTLLYALANSLLARFGRTGDLTTLEDAVEAAAAAVNAAPAGYPDRPAALASLANVLLARFERRGRLADLDAAIDAAQAALDANPAGHPDRAGRLSNLGHALLTRFERRANPADLDAAISAGQAALDATRVGHPDRAAVLTSLGNALSARFEDTGRLTDLDALVDARQAALNATSAGHPARAGYLSNLGSALHSRFLRTGAATDIDTAIQILQDAVKTAPADHPDRAVMLSNLGAVLKARFLRTGTATDIDTAIQTLQDAAKGTPADHPDRSRRLASLGNAFQARSSRTGDLADLDDAIATLRTAAGAASANDLMRATALADLGDALRKRFGRTGKPADLDAAINNIRAAIEAIPAGHRSQAGMLAKVGVALRTRFERSGALADLDAAIDAGRAAVDAVPADELDRATMLSSLGNALSARFERTGDMTDLDAAISAGQAALEAAPAEYPVRAALHLSSLGLALQIRFSRAGNIADIAAAIEFLQKAADTIPEDHPARALILTNLGAALHRRYDRADAPADSDAAIKSLREAADATPEDHPARAMVLTNLGIMLQTRFGRTGEQDDLDQALGLFSHAAGMTATAPSPRIQAARAASELAARSQPEWAATILKQAVLLLPEVAPRQLERSDQQYALGGMSGLAGDAAAMVLAAPATPPSESATLALQLLETGRAVLLSQALAVRGDLTDLTDHHPALAARFVRLRELLDRGYQPAITVKLADFGDPDDEIRSGSDHDPGDRQQLANELAAVTAEIRTQEGFSTFAQPPSTAELLQQATDGPVVVFNISKYRSDALLLTKDTITSLPLPELTIATVTDQISALHQAVHTADEQQLSGILQWLWDAAAGPVLDTLGYRTQPGPGIPQPRIWWVPGGLMSLLPIHAAGHHGDPASAPSKRTVIDRVISSSTPTITALRHARRAAATPARPDKTPSALIVAMPATPGLPGLGRLRFVPDEARKLSTRLPRSITLTEPDPVPGDETPDAALPDTTPTRARVFSHLATCPVAHFACHGTVDPADPSKSHLLLHDHRHAPLTVAALASVHLEHARLAYLSACDTALSASPQLIDEAIHLTSAFQLAGYRHVIGTLWAINDQTAVQIADAFYAALTSTSTGLDTSKAATALHQAVRNARDASPATPSLWAAHIHAGA